MAATRIEDCKKTTAELAAERERYLQIAETAVAYQLARAAADGDFFHAHDIRHLAEAVRVLRG